MEAIAAIIAIIVFLIGYAIVPERWENKYCLWCMRISFGLVGLAFMFMMAYGVICLLGVKE